MFAITKTLEFPKPLKPIFKKAIKLEWISFLYMISAALFSFTVMSNSQTMKTIWLEDTLGIIPPLSFLIGSIIVKKPANANFPYGFHRIINLTYLSSSLALFILGLYLLGDGISVLLSKEHPTIPTIFIGERSIWLGYLMITALLWSSVPSTILGHLKIPLSYQLFDKTLFADSKMNKASWMSGFASIIGIIGIGFGFWWADASVGILVSINIINDGYINLKQSLLDLLDKIPKSINKMSNDPLLIEVKNIVENESWVKSMKFRFRDEGHVFFGDIFIEPQEKNIDVEIVKALQTKIKKYHWRLHDIIIMLV